ncbi:hypothetical protein [Anoxybacillus ayderensis]|uniref:hypothetical protein n=1 Tax=Anoxybacillus ayderensis TaxID=265546 RepID=UPI000A27244E|nr:hypothetical protein [Anoxybacillus ayderensis]MBA2878286.1 hypothetical protein [Anoxybacillus ayderensis]MED0657348.1 hypothetical protein [Anoxybacillus ayderensis]OSX55532.1 hypothetical protein B7H16_01225 [Anoxybacillus ayderensis]
MKKSYIAFFAFLVCLLYISWSKEGWKGILLLFLKGIVIFVIVYSVVFVIVWSIMKLVGFLKRRLQ